MRDRVLGLLAVDDQDDDTVLGHLALARLHAKRCVSMLPKKAQDNPVLELQCSGK